MKREIAFVLFILTFNLVLTAQDTAGVIRLNPTLYRELLNREFVNLINPQSENILGNFASLDSKNSELNFAGNFISDSGSVLGIRLKGSSPDGALEIFSNSKINSQLGFDIQFNHMTLSKRKLLFDIPSYLSYLEKKRKIEYNSIIKMNHIEQRTDSTNLVIEIEKLEAKKDNVLYELSILEFKYDTTIISEKTKELGLKVKDLKAQIDNESDNEKKDSLSYVYLMCKREIELKERRLEKHSILNSRKRDSLNISLFELENKIKQKKEEFNNLRLKKELLNNLLSWKVNELNTIKKDVLINGFKIGWFSIGYGLSYNSFNHFDSLLVADEQIQEKSCSNHQIRVQYSFYRYLPIPYKSYYWSCGFSLAIEDNLSELASKEINEKVDYGALPDKRYSIEKYNVFIGDYQKCLISIRIYGDFYYFLFIDNKAAIHFYPEIMIREDYNPAMNLGFGFVTVFRKKDNSLLNAELYYNLIDITESNDHEHNLLSRSNLGIRFTFPIQFNSKIK